MLVFLVSGYGHGFFFNASLFFTSLFSFNIIEKRKKGAISSVSQRKSIYLQSNCGYQKDISI